ncbi:MAG: Gfo/Idh/MocA family oxidoreductase [Candidatus Marinimicrobia bacterium]|nr:Gfo/Idh/MocA family oxidoreductase [Candidatus Neomarinimicrobiota bacterium]
MIKNENKIKVGLFGVGKFGTYHLQNLLEIPEIELVGFCDIDPEKQKLIPKKYNIKYYSQSDLIDLVDVVDVVVPTISHFGIAKEALQNGKHVFIEKPVTQTVSQIKELNKIAEKNNLKISVGHIERFNPIFVKTKEKYDLKPSFIEIHRVGKFNPLRGVDVPVIMELMIHDLDLLLYTIDAEVTNISAVGTKVLSSECDIVNARIEFANGTVANITASRISDKKMRKVRIFQKNLYVSMDFLNNKADVYSLLNENNNQKNFNSKILSKIPKDFSKIINYDKIEPKKYNALKMELSEFVKSIISDTTPIVTGEDGFKALELATKIEESIKNKQ